MLLSFSSLESEIAAAESALKQRLGGVVGHRRTHLGHQCIASSTNDITRHLLRHEILHLRGIRIRGR